MARSAAWISDSGWTVTFSGTGPYDGGGPFYFRRLESDLGATAETSRAPRQDGVTTWHTALDARTVNLTGGMWVLGDKSHPAPAQFDRMRSYLHQAFAPSRWGTLIYYREDGAVQLRCRPIATPTLGESVGTYCTIDISFTSDSPYWESAEEQVVCVGAIQKFWHFPWAPVRGPMGAFNRAAILENPTAELIYPTVEVYATGQYVTLTNAAAGASITIEHAIEDGQKLTVDLRDVTAYLYTLNESGVYGDAEDVSHWMSLDSEPWGLLPGRNRVTISNEVPEDTPLSYIRYRIPSLGV